MVDDRSNDCSFCALVGLGNPGETYRNNRHNIGFRVIDAIAEEYAPSASFRNMALLAEILPFNFGRYRLLLVKPKTFMNLSGRAVKFLADFYKLSGDNIFMFHDDIDLPFSQVKIKKGGGHGGHNGLRSIDDIFGQNYWRIRIGIGRPEHKTMVSDYVLGDFDQEQEKVINDLLCRLSKNIQTMLQEPQKLPQLL
ncbi:MAG: aminoacyl-tRNA hydrolase [Holosporaceae bacterium]|nr:aminoacyl-tRNA hydrolase [Holosporaceae bacterium]